MNNSIRTYCFLLFFALSSTVSAETLVMRLRTQTLALWNVGGRPSINTTSDSVYVKCNGQTASYDPLDVLSIRLSDRSIEELERNPEETADKSIVVTDFTIKISGATHQVALYSSDGKCLAEKKANGTIELPKPQTPGIYMVGIDDEHIKIIIR